MSAATRVAARGDELLAAGAYRLANEQEAVRQGRRPTVTRAALLFVLGVAPAFAGDPAGEWRLGIETGERLARGGADSLERAYRAAYHDVAARRGDEAVARASRFEREIRESSPRAFELLDEAERRGLAALAKADATALFELLPFYRELAATHGRLGEASLQARANRTVRDLLATLYERYEGGASARLVAIALQGHAADLLANNAPTLAGNALVSSLRLAPDDADANLALAILLQREGRTEAALGQLDRVVALEPGHREARLRRAILRASGVSAADAGMELEAIASGGESDWIAALAAQERARQLQAAGEHRECVAWLERIGGRFPDEPPLSVALAFSLRRVGRRAGAAAAADEAMVVRSGSGTTARRRYGASPAPLLRARDGELRAAIEQSRGKLAMALRDTEPALGAGGVVR